MIVGCYALDLYCEGIVLRRDRSDGPWLPVQCHRSGSFGEMARQFYDAARQARRAGWYVRQAGAKEELVLCPECVAYGKTKEARRGLLRVQLHGTTQAPPTEQELALAQRGARG